MPSSGVQTCARSEEHTSELQHGSISYAVSLDRKSTRLNSSHGSISYAVFCLKKKNKRMKSTDVTAWTAGACLHPGLCGIWRGLRPRASARSGGVPLAVSDPAFLFFFNDTATTEIYTLSLHDALPI